MPDSILTQICKSFSITKDYAKKLEQREEIFKRVTGTTKQIFTVIIAANGIKENKYSKELISGVVTLDDLFKEIR